METLNSTNMKTPAAFYYPIDVISAAYSSVAGHPTPIGMKLLEEKAASVRVFAPGVSAAEAHWLIGAIGHSPIPSSPYLSGSNYLAEIVQCHRPDPASTGVSLFSTRLRAMSRPKAQALVCQASYYYVARAMVQRRGSQPLLESFFTITLRQSYEVFFPFQNHHKTTHTQPTPSTSGAPTH